jgi:hypothetical protein
MDEARVEAVKLALFGLFENKSGKDVLTIELKPRLPRGITDEEFDAAMDQLETQHYVSYRETGNPYRNAFVRGAAFQKWSAEVRHPQSNTFNVSGHSFSGPTQFGTGNVLNVQINESDSQQLIALVEELIKNPQAKERATPILDALKSGAIETAKEALVQILKGVFGGA